MKPLQDFLSDEVKAELVRPVPSYDPRDAEILPGQTPKWHLLEVHEPAQTDVAAELIKRRFGVFVPEKFETIIARGRKIDRRQWLFPGYIFVFVWDIDRHWDRIARISGVSQIVSSQPSLGGYQAKTVQGKLAARVVTPDAYRSALTIDDDVIDQIRAIENGLQPTRKRRTRGKHDDDVIVTYPASAFPDRLWMLDFEQRNQTLRKALGLS